MWQNQRGIQFFKSVPEAIRAGYEVLSVYPDANGYLPARTKLDATRYGLALVAVREG
jgi:hypothetical protein